VGQTEFLVNYKLGLTHRLLETAQSTYFASRNKNVPFGPAS